MATIPQSKSELESHLHDHLDFLASSAIAFDEGKVGEAKRISVSLRVLFHDTTQSHSLLGQLDRLQAKFFSSAAPHQAASLTSHGGLVMIAMSPSGATYYAPLDDVPWSRWLPFQDWWNEIVFVDDQRSELTRKGLVLAVANQDGGAHVDPNLSETYARLSKHNSLGWVHEPGRKPIENAARAAIRQIGHESLKTLQPGYQRMPKVEADILVANPVMFMGSAVPDAPKRPKIGRNEACPCGSGRKYKKCHGAI